MADKDLLPARGVPFYALVDELGVAVGGTLTMAQLSTRGMRSVCEVDSAGLVNGVTVAQLASRGIRPFCAVDETGVSSDGVTLLQLGQRGIRGLCPVDALGIAQGGTLTIPQLAQRGIGYFCPVDESGAETAVASTGVDHFDAFGATQPFVGIVTPNPGIYVQATNKTWVSFEAYNGSTREERVRVYDHDTGEWSLTYNSGLTTLVDDDHGVPGQCPLDDGRVMIAGGAQTSDMRIAVTTNPDDPSAWTQQAAIAGDYTYPVMSNVGGLVYLFMHRTTFGPPDIRHLVLRIGTMTGASVAWSADIEIATFDSVGGERFYHGNTIVRGTEIHIVASRATADATVLSDVYKLVYETVDGSVRNSADTVTVASGSLPVTRAQMDASFRLVEIGAGNKGLMPSLGFDTTGREHIVYESGAIATDGPYSCLHISSDDGITWSDPTTVGTLPTEQAVTSYGVVPLTNGDIDVYFCTQSPINNNNALGGRGGDISARKRLSAGTWEAARIVRACTAEWLLNGISPIADAHADARVMFSECANGINSGGSESPDEGANLKSYLLGDSGYVKAPFYCSDALRFFATWSAPPTTTEKNAIDALIKTFIYGDVMHRLDTFKDTGLRDSTAALLNWKNALHPGTLDPSATRVANGGITGDGAHYSFSDAHTGTGTRWSANSASFIVRSRTAGQEAVGGSIWGARRTGVVSAFLLPRNGSDQLLWRINDLTTTTVAAQTDGSGIFIGTRTNSATRKLYRNGVLVSNAAVAQNSAVNELIVFGANGAGSTSNSTRQLDIMALGSDLDPVVATIQTALTTYLAAMGRT